MLTIRAKVKLEYVVSFGSFINIAWILRVSLWKPCCELRFTIIGKDEKMCRRKIAKHINKTPPWYHHHQVEYYHSAVDTNVLCRLLYLHCEAMKYCYIVNMPIHHHNIKQVAVPCPTWSCH